MGVDAILQELEKRLGELDERTKEAFRMALELSRQAQPSQPEEPQCQGENPLQPKVTLDFAQRQTGVAF